MGVYHPYRLDVLGTCRVYRGTVLYIRPEDDGDYHVVVRPDTGYGNYLDLDNHTEQHGGLVTEIMPGQNLGQPYVGEHLAIYGTWVHDSDHGWNEIHPIWAIRHQGSSSWTYDRPPVPPRYDAGSTSGGGGGGGGSGGDCTPGYSPCLPQGPSDYDCYGGGGDGPAYTKPGVVYRVTGSDPYRLDGNNDGYACG